MAVLTPSPISLQTSYVEDASPIADEPSKAVPFKPPVLASSAPSQPSALQEQNFALFKLKQALDAPAITESEKASQKERVAECLKEVRERIPKGPIDLSQETFYDTETFKLLSQDCYDKISRELEYQETAFALAEFQMKFQEANKDLPEPEREKHGLRFGTCLGQTVAHVKKGALVADDGIATTGRFFEAAYVLDASQELRNPNSAGEKILLRFEEFSFLHEKADKAARILGYASGTEMVSKALLESPDARYPRNAIERLLAKLAIPAWRENYLKTNLLLKELKDKTNKMVEIKKNLLATLDTQKIEELTKEQQALQKEIDELKLAIAECNNRALCFGEIFRDAGSRKDEEVLIPELILKKHGIRKGDKILEESPIKDLAKNLKGLSDKKGMFSLHLFGEKSSESHSILISFDPPFFSDINDKCHLTGKKKIRRFTSLDELLTFLPDYIAFKYPHERFQFADLTHYEKIGPMETPPRETVKAAEAADKALIS